MKQFCTGADWTSLDTTDDLFHARAITPSTPRQSIIGARRRLTCGVRHQLIVHDLADLAVPVLDFVLEEDPGEQRKSRAAARRALDQWALGRGAVRVNLFTPGDRGMCS
eukprot:TRINITY_DN7859_c0_g2_i7.p2 TRINITY_DN7859_c0_g2~~TRINITY_DN7859_c0_g2_i7.p2  ORF type:complete len:109 (-),score=1.51 TRINITY_DN7859_c0_g2_i7:640-966(-)